VTVRLYPWWEHPLYQRARDTGENWGFRHLEGAAKEVTVVAVNPRQCRLSQREEVVDWEFCERHPHAWRYEDEGEVFCNTTPDIPRVVDAILARKLPFITRALLDDYLPNRDWKAPASLGYFPYTLYGPVCDELQRSAVRLHLPRVPVERDTPIVLTMDDDDYLIADDFELEVPEFEHRPEWFAP
jgi:hypothetical protein